jgi:hypothetical protein
MQKQAEYIALRAEIIGLRLELAASEMVKRDKND